MTEPREGEVPVQVLEERRAHAEVAVVARHDFVTAEGTPGPGHPDGDAVATVVGGLVMTLSLAAYVWLVVVGFVGGVVPAVGWRLSGGFLPGLAWLGFMSTLGVAAIVAAPLLGAALVSRAVARLVPVRTDPR